MGNNEGRRNLSTWKSAHLIYDTKKRQQVSPFTPIIYFYCVLHNKRHEKDEEK